MEKLVEFSPAYDKRNSNPAKNYGIHGVDIKFILKNGNKAVQFVIYSNWYLPRVTREMINKPISDKLDLECRFLPMPADVGYHSPIPLYGEQTKITENCPYTGGDCYYDGSGLYAEEVFDKLVSGGSEAV